MLNIPRPIGTFAFLMAWLIPWKSVFRVRAGAQKLVFFAHRRDTIGRHIAKYGTHEPLLTKWLADYLEAAPAALVVDVGANIGWHALHAAQHNNVEAVVAFEPDTFNAWLLERNLAANEIDKVIVNACAVGREAGVARLFRYKSSNFGRHSIVNDYGYGGRAVPITDLDGALERLGFGERAISVIKIDVEGYEPAVLAGAHKTLERTEAVIVEYSPDLSSGGGLSAEVMLDQLSRAGFVPFLMRHDGGTVRIGAENLQRLDGTIDVIWARPDRWTSEVARAMKQRTRDKLSLLEIAEQNKRVKKPIR
jgi:FkbM family methyltransferase